MILDRARAKPGALGALRLWICGFGALLAAALAGCSTNTNVSNGTPVVTVTTQAAGDFSTYVVGISLYSLTRSDGYVAYPAGYTAEEFADLTQRVDLTELLNAVGVPTGTYKSVVIGIDYSLPVVYLNGQTTEAGVENTAGVADPGIVYVTVNLDPAHPLVIGLNQSTPFALDFDLAASNTISSGTVIIHPFVAATATPTDTQPIRARGLLVIANPTSNNLVEDIRPFEDNVYATVGALTVNTTANTYYNVNGAVFIGNAGLQAISRLAANIPIEAYGTLDGSPPGSNPTITPSYTATQVYAGTVVSNGEYEHVRGIVSAVNGNSLTVQGATYLYYEGYCISNICFTYNPTATVNLSTATPVTEDDALPPSGTTFSTQSISVGTQIDAIGLGTTDATGALTLDATQGYLRIQSTPIWGTLNSGAPGTATLNVVALGTAGFAPSLFNFAGSGTAGNDAVPTSYVVDTAAAGAQADQSATTAGTLLRVDGFPAAFGAAPPDFNATDVIPGSSAPSNLIVEWAGGAGTTAPFTSYDSTSLALNLTNASLAQVVTGPEPTGASCPAAACASLSGTPAITITGATQFAIGNATNGISMFSSSSAFASDLTSALNGSTSVYRVVAMGSFDAASNTFNATRVDISLE